MYINTNSDFSNKINAHINEEYGSLFEENIVISKRVKSIRFLKNTEKEWTRLCYKEAILRGVTLVNHIQCYIASKTKIWIERTGIEYLKKSEELEDKAWFYKMAKNHHIYIGLYRKVIDELELSKKELWNVIMNPSSEDSVKIQSLREIHSMTKTITLLIRDLPFVTNLSDYYDQDKVDSMFVMSKESNRPSRALENIVEDRSQNEPTIKPKDSIKVSGLEGLINKDKISNAERINQSEGKLQANVDDSIMEEMSKQLNDSSSYLDTKGYYESIKKLKAIFEYDLSDSN